MSEKMPIEKWYSTFFESELPPDLILILLWLPAALVTIHLPILNESFLRYMLTIPVVLFIPGYCLIAALFPKKDDISNMERIALSVGLSAVIIPLIGLGLNFTTLGIRLNPIILSLSTFSLVMVLVAHYRRAILPCEERFMVRFSIIMESIRNGIYPVENSKVDRILAIVLAFMIFAAILTTIYVITFPKEGEPFTEFFILGENKMATDYPDLMIAGQNYPMFIGVGNHEYRNMTYTIETWTSLTEFNNLTNSTTVLVMDPLDRQSLTLAHNETMTIPYTLSVNTTGYNRVEFLLFNETVPGPEVTGSDRINASYRSLNLGVSIR